MQPTLQATLATTSALDEETARAEVYGLLAALYYAPPSAELMAQLRVAVTEAPAAGAFLEEPWRALVAAARALDDQAVSDEYDALFGGMGKPEIYLFGSHYLSGFLHEKPLAPPWMGSMCEAIAAHPKARFYAALSVFTQAFASVETQGFDLLN